MNTSKKITADENAYFTRLYEIYDQERKPIFPECIVPAPTENQIEELYAWVEEFAVELPASISEMADPRSEELYTILDLPCNVTYLPDSFSILTRLKSLTLFCTKIERIPDSIGQLKNLDSICFLKNRITSLPESLFTLPRLRFVSLSDNRITSLPESIGYAQRLEEIMMDDNPISELPNSIVNCSKLQAISMCAQISNLFPKGFRGI